MWFIAHHYVVDRARCATRNVGDIVGSISVLHVLGFVHGSCGIGKLVVIQAGMHCVVVGFLGSAQHQALATG